MSELCKRGCTIIGPHVVCSTEPASAFTITLAAFSRIHGRPCRGYDYEVTDASGTVVAEGWTVAATKAEAEKQATDHAYRNIAARARKSAPKESR